MLEITVIKLAIDDSFSMFDKMNAEIWNNAADKFAEDLKEKFKDHVATDRKAVITLKVDREKGLLIEKDYQFKNMG